MVVIVLLVLCKKRTLALVNRSWVSLAVGRRTPVGDGLCKLGAEQLCAQEYVHKHQNDQCAAVLSGELGAPPIAIVSDERFSDGEEHGCDKSAQYKIAPGIGVKMARKTRRC
jgi:hypothetical protein